MKLTDKQKDTFQKLRQNLPDFARNCLYIKTKDAEIAPLLLNDSQFYFHQRIEKHKRERGKVRVVVVKGRQQGLSTYTEARFFHKCAYNKGYSSFIVSEGKDSTENIFEMVKRYYNKIPQGMPKPDLLASNRKELSFAEIDSIIRTGTAGNTNVGVSTTNHLLHCSEVGLWTNGSELIRGLFQTVPKSDNSEIIIESTPRGTGGIFHELAMTGLDDRAEWETIFIPWFMHKEYAQALTPDFTLTDEERELAYLHDLSREQLNWRRGKILNEFKGREWLFKQEYPCSVNEAFSSADNGLIEGRYIEKARKANLLGSERDLPIICGVDPARKGGDRTVIVLRRGREVFDIIKYDQMEQMELAGILGTLINKYHIARLFMDVAHGYGTIDRLTERGYGHIVEGIHFGQSADKKDIYANKRAEMYGEMRDWFIQAGDVSVPDNDELATDLASIPDFKQNSSSRFILPSKDEIKAQLGKSPDMADALVLTFAQNTPIIQGDTAGIRIKLKQSTSRRLK